MRTKNVNIVHSCKYNVFLLSQAFRNRLFTKVSKHAFVYLLVARSVKSIVR